MDTIETLKEKLEKKDKAIAMLYKYVNRAETERDQLKKSFREYVERDKRSKDFTNSYKEKIRKLKKILDYHNIDHKKILSDFSEKAKYKIL